LNENLKPLLTFPIADDPNIGSREIPVSRITLRKVLLQGLETMVNFEKRFHHFDQREDGRVVAYFEDGSTVEGDLLIGG